MRSQSVLDQFLQLGNLALITGVAVSWRPWHRAGHHPGHWSGDWSSTGVLVTIHLQICWLIRPLHSLHIQQLGQLCSVCIWYYNILLCIRLVIISYPAPVSCTAPRMQHQAPEVTSQLLTTFLLESFLMIRYCCGCTSDKLNNRDCWPLITSLV